MKTKLKYAFVVLASAFLANNVQAQARLDLSDPAQFAVYNSYSEMKGVPFLFKDWALATVKTVDNAVKKDVQVKFDEIDDRLLLKGDGEQMLTFSSPVAEFVIADPEKGGTRKFKAGFAPTKFSTEKSLFEILVDGKVKLLRKNHKSVSEGKQYGSAAVIKSINDEIRYYLVKDNNEPILIKLDQKSINAVLADKEAELTAYTKTNKLNLKKDADAIKLINYYNTL